MSIEVTRVWKIKGIIIEIIVSLKGLKASIHLATKSRDIVSRQSRLSLDCHSTMSSAHTYGGSYATEIDVLLLL